MSTTDLAQGLDSEIRRYVELRDRAAEQERLAKDAKVAMEEQRDRLWDLLDASGVKTINHELGRITRTARLQAIVTDDESLASWLEQEGLVEAMTKREYRKANLNGLASELLDEGRALPDGLDTLTVRGIRYTRS